MLEASNTTKTAIIATRKETYLPTYLNKIPDLLDFFVVKDILFNYLKAERLIELMLNHIPNVQIL